MKVALVHDYLNQYGGGERVLEVLMEMFPEAPIYTILHDSKKTGGRFRQRVAGTSFLDFQFARDNHRWFIPLMPLAAQSLLLDNKFDLVISDTAGFAKGIVLGSKAKHLSYIHTPLRYAWETKDYFNNPVFTAVFSPIFKYLRSWDYKKAQGPDVLLANSNFIAGKIKSYYQRDAQVIYPPVDTAVFYREVNSSKLPVRNYYLAVGRMLHYKRFDLIIEACAKLKLPLKIVGTGPEYQKLKTKIENLKAVNIELLPFVTDADLRTLYNGAKALIFPQVEDFGLVAAEAQACGTPVIAYRAGGAKEILEDGVTGIFFNEQTTESLAAAISDFEKKKFSRVKIAAAGKRFSKENFKKQIVDAITLLG